jgi:hypothetical protein
MCTLPYDKNNGTIVQQDVKIPDLILYVTFSKSKP